MAGIPKDHGRIHPLAMDKPRVAEVSDLRQQVWAFQRQVLVAVPRSENVAPVPVPIITNKNPDSLEKDKGNPIYLGIQSPEMCLCCEDIGGQPKLQLKDRKIMDLYNEAEPVKPFLFYHSQTGSTSSFESVAFPGCFIASSERGQPIILTSELGTTYNTAFHIDFKD
ncbi:interleukin-36 gamma-like [Hippopotamus amphibius kiboko]|uniref:interleukin-36 gamma-like n=1 Tax=Hippopotamus amphibius kiboko TaxID=575201 RepID=UPI0025944F90|nr:interleukin-36 gamma-like [Hippopotamus amphibius kiboko]XP_057598848.1 interleukin-36 gamma-like [Hippopotamus amphibius kiboko]XP_057598850.1 interleukin-36 gamma-like [Hippopotamus amphibius kiboko]XP_057598851.1 interleukin-36 gamma-like [Hippopotamus amphibius kiboko]